MRLTPLTPLLLATLLVPVGLLPAQTAPGAELWRVAAVTLPLPPALTTGATGSFWNPAQPPRPGAGWLGIDLIQTPEAVGAAGMLVAAGLPLRSVGSVGLVYARMGLSDLVRTIDTPDPAGEAIPFHTQELRLVAATTLHGLTAGVGLVYRDTRFDDAVVSSWGVDLGLVQRFGERLRVAAATRGFRRVEGDPAQDLFAGIEYRLWRGALWRGTPGAVRTRYGIAGGHGGSVDQQLGAGLEVGTVLRLDAEVEREAAYGHAAWRGAAGLRVVIGRYRLTLARDGGISDLGSTFRVGLEARLR